MFTLGELLLMPLQCQAINTIYSGSTGKPGKDRTTHSSSLFVPRTLKFVCQCSYLTDEILSLSLQDVDKPCDTLLQQVSIEEILEEQRLQQQAKQETEKVKMQVLKDRGLSIPKADNLDEY